MNKKSLRAALISSLVVFLYLPLVNAQPTPEEASVIYAAANGRLDILQKIFDPANPSTPDIDCTNFQGRTPLIAAAEKGHTDTIRFLIERGANPNIKLLPSDKFTADEDSTALHLAVGRNQPGAVAFLARIEKTDVNISRACDGYTPLHLAAHQGFDACFKALVKKGGADLSLQTTKGDTALHLAIRGKHREIILFILSREDNIGINQRDSNGYPPLCVATFDHDMEMVELLLEQGANINLACSTGHTPLHIAIHNHFKKAFSCLLTLAKADDLNNVTFDEGHTPLHLAANHGYYKFAVKLLDAGANINVLATNNFNALTIACEKGHLKMVKLLVKRGIELNPVSIDDQATPIMYAIEKGHKNIVEFLAKKRMLNLEHQDKYGENPFQQAKGCGYKKMSQILASAQKRRRPGKQGAYMQLKEISPTPDISAHTTLVPATPVYDTPVRLTPTPVTPTPDTPVRTVSAPVNHTPVY